MGLALLVGVPRPGAAQEAAVRPTSDTIESAATDTATAPPLYILDPIEATATRARATAPPVATIVVDPEVVRRTTAENPYDLIRRVTHLEVHDQGQGPGFSSNVVLRGFTADHSSDLLLTVDGVPVNLPVHGHIEGYADWNFIFPGALSSLRVIHGPSSPLHGDFAISGAVEIYTEPDADGVRGSASANGFGDVSGWATAGRRGDDGGGLVGVDLRRAEGWRDNSDRTIGNALVRGWRSVGGDARLEGGIALHSARWNAPGFLSIERFEEGRLEAAANGSDGGEQGRAVVHGRYATPVGSDEFLQIMGWGVLSDLDLFLMTPGHEDALGNLYQSSESDRRWGAGGEVEYAWIPGWGELTVGTSVRTDRSKYDKGRTLRRNPIEGEVALDAEHTAAGLYVRWRRTIADRVGLDLGARVDHLRYRSLNRLGMDDASVSLHGGHAPFLGAASAAPSPSGVAVPVPPSFHIVGDQGPVGEWVDGSFTVASPKLGARIAVTSRVSLTASTSRGFRSAVGVVGDPDRPPFLAWAHELGVDYERARFDGHASLYRTRVTNERIQDPVTLAISSAGSSVRQGVEAEFMLDVGREVVVSGRFTYTDANLSGRYADAHHDHADDGGETEDPDANDGAGQRVPGVAEYNATLAIETPLRRGITGRAAWRVTGPYVPIGEPEVTTEPYSVMDVGFSLPFGERFAVDLEVRNVLDDVYAEMRSSGYVSPGTPRSFGVTVHYLGAN